MNWDRCLKEAAISLSPRTDGEDLLDDEGGELRCLYASMSSNGIGEIGDRGVDLPVDNDGTGFALSGTGLTDLVRTRHF